MKTLKNILIFILGAALAAGVVLLVVYRDKIFKKNDQNQEETQIEEKTDTKTDEIAKTASITILSDGSTRLNK